MAKMTFKLPEETIRKMEALGSHYDAVTSAVLEEGVKPLYDAAKQSLSSVIGRSLCTMLRNRAFLPLLVRGQKNHGNQQVICWILCLSRSLINLQMETGT